MLKSINVVIVQKRLPYEIINVKAFSKSEKAKEFFDFYLEYYKNDYPYKDSDYSEVALKNGRAYLNFGYSEKDIKIRVEQYLTDYE